MNFISTVLSALRRWRWVPFQKLLAALLIVVAHAAPSSANQIAYISFSGQIGLLGPIYNAPPMFLPAIDNHNYPVDFVNIDNPADKQTAYFHFSHVSNTYIGGGYCNDIWKVSYNFFSFGSLPFFDDGVFSFNGENGSQKLSYYVTPVNYSIPWTYNGVVPGVAGFYTHPITPDSGYFTLDYRIPCPEPSSLALLLSAGTLGAILFLWRRRLRRAALQSPA